MSLPAITYQVIKILLRLEKWVLLWSCCKIGADGQYVTFPLLLPGTGCAGLCPRVGSHIPLPHLHPHLLLSPVRSQVLKYRIHILFIFVSAVSGTWSFVNKSIKWNKMN